MKPIEYINLLLENVNKYIVYHGTNNKFNLFDLKYLGSERGKTPSNLRGFYFSDNKDVAKSFGKYLLTAEIFFRNPLIINAKGKNYSEFKHKLNDIILNLNKKYDGIIIKDYVDSMSDNPQSSTQYVVFNINQIRIIND